MGVAGSVAASRSCVVHVPALSLPAAGPVTGAGDALDAGVLVGLPAGPELDEASALGTSAARRALER